MLQTAAASGGAVEIAFGVGVYDFTALRTPSGALVVASLNDLNGLTLRGVGRGGPSCGSCRSRTSTAELLPSGTPT